MSVSTLTRTATTRHFLMCRPTHLHLDYDAHPWLSPGRPVDTVLAVAQWERLRDTYLAYGHTVDLIDPVEGMPGMVFTANSATVIDDRVLLTRQPDRQAEAPVFRQWFSRRGYREVRAAEFGDGADGDCVVAGGIVLAGSVTAAPPRSHSEIRQVLTRPVVSLHLVDPRFRHLDTALAALSDTEIMFYPEAFSAESLRTLHQLYPDAIHVDEVDAVNFGLNAVSDGQRVFLPDTAAGLAAHLGDRGFTPVGIDVSELLRAGGGVRCCTSEIRHRRKT